MANELVKTVARATNTSSLLPGVEEYEFLGTYPSFIKRTNRMAERIQGLLAVLAGSVDGGLGGVLENTARQDVPDAFRGLNGVVDGLLEGADMAMDRDKGLFSKTGKGAAAAPHPSSSSSRVSRAHTVRRPQDSFDVAVDNSRETPFVHPPLAHDAGRALDELSYSQEVLGPVQPTMYASMEDTPLVWVDTLSGLRGMIGDLAHVPAVAIDLEAHSYRSFQGFVCLMQVSSRTRDYLVDTLALRSELHEFNTITTDPAILKVLHGANSDIVWFQRDFGIYMVNMFDTGQAARVLNFPSFGLAHLLKFYCSVNTNKSFQLADWRIRPLPQDMAKYARMDTHYLLYIFDRLKNELVARGNETNNLMHSVLARSREICAFRYEKLHFTPDSWRAAYERSPSRLSRTQQAVFAALYEWRDRVARDRDESTGFVLPNALLARLALASPSSVGELLSACNPIPPLIRTYASDVVDIIVAATISASGTSSSSSSAPSGSSGGASSGGASASASGGPTRRKQASRQSRQSQKRERDSAQMVDASAVFSEQLFRTAGWLGKPVMVSAIMGEHDIVPQSGSSSSRGSSSSSSSASANKVAGSLGKAPAWGGNKSTAPDVAAASGGSAAAKASQVFRDIAEGISFPKIQPLLQTNVSSSEAQEVIDLIPQPQTMSDIYILSNLNRKQSRKRPVPQPSDASSSSAGGSEPPNKRGKSLAIEAGTAIDPVQLMEQMGWPIKDALETVANEDAASQAFPADAAKKAFKSHNYNNNGNSNNASNSNASNSNGNGKGKRSKSSNGNNKRSAPFDPFKKGGNGGNGGGKKGNGGGKGKSKSGDKKSGASNNKNSSQGGSGGGGGGGGRRGRRRNHNKSSSYRS